jgi:hypothetical protein
MIEGPTISDEVWLLFQPDVTEKALSYPGLVDGHLVHPESMAYRAFEWLERPSSFLPSGPHGFQFMIAVGLQIYRIEVGGHAAFTAQFSEQLLDRHRDYRTALSALLADESIQSSDQIRGQIGRFVDTMDGFEQNLRAAVEIRVDAFMSRIEDQFGLLGSRDAESRLGRQLFEVTQRWTNLIQADCLRHSIELMAHFGLERKDEDRESARQRAYKRATRLSEYSGKQLRGAEKLIPALLKILQLTAPPKKRQS